EPLGEDCSGSLGLRERGVQVGLLPTTKPEFPEREPGPPASCAAVPDGSCPMLHELESARGCLRNLTHSVSVPERVDIRGVRNGSMKNVGKNADVAGGKPALRFRGSLLQFVAP